MKKRDHKHRIKKPYWEPTELEIKERKYKLRWMQIMRFSAAFITQVMQHDTPPYEEVERLVKVYGWKPQRIESYYQEPELHYGT